MEILEAARREYHEDNAQPDQGRWEAAKALFVEVVETSKTKLGKDHPNTLTSMCNLAFIWKGQGHYAEAIQLMKECVKLRNRILGVSHPHCMSSLKALAGWEVKQADVAVSNWDS
ncbi:uncharacterized protein BDR25DRAFT_320196 [Lindgomyces ingoldianus]|uniref:Uncharacterized protein n=1 Tax=Lindgomyces ingoldianus TaxID=673940 RepID=A0ACB6Q853_9PLEO|nr:uncharacterized protein BDR25DRAFT_320196 [Lindgomyces ingoldianus]KAF2463184.1 hypothetical protein BDR25DRAFT_320196 [Lindgomyces ingoldianus]